MRRNSDAAEEDRLIRDSARRWLEKSFPWPSPQPERLTAIAEDGWFAMGLPPELEGNGADRSQCMIVLEEAGRVQLLEDLIPALLLLPAIAERMPAETLAALTTGAARLGFAPCAQAEAPFSAIAAGLAMADFVLLSTPDRVALAPGAELSLEVARLMDGRGAGRVANPSQLPPGATLLASGEEAKALHARLGDLAAFGAAADALGAFEAGFAVVIDHLKTRHQFRQPLAAFQAVQQHMANAFAAQESFRSLVIAAGLAETAEDRATLRRHLALGLRNRLLPAAGLCIQVSGGMGMTEDFIAGHLYRRLQTAAALSLALPPCAARPVEARTAA